MITQHFVTFNITRRLRPNFLFPQKFSKLDSQKVIIHTRTQIIFTLRNYFLYMTLHRSNTPFFFVCSYSQRSIILRSGKISFKLNRHHHQRAGSCCCGLYLGHVHQPLLRSQWCLVNETLSCGPEAEITQLIHTESLLCAL